jgi:hypothetical protein
VKRGLATGKIELLNHSYRMPKKILQEIKDGHIIPAKDFPKSVGVEGTGVTKQEITVTQADPGVDMSPVLASKIYHLVARRGIHPGYIAVLYPVEAETAVFPSGLPAFLQLLNTELRSKVAVAHAQHAPQVSDKMEDGLLYRPQPSTGVLAARLMVGDGTTDVRDNAQYWCDRHQQVIPTNLVPSLTLLPQSSRRSLLSQMLSTSPIGFAFVTI